MNPDKPARPGREFVLDEAFAVPSAHLDALRPRISAQPVGPVIYGVDVPLEPATASAPVFRDCPQGADCAPYEDHDHDPFNFDAFGSAPTRAELDKARTLDDGDGDELHVTAWLEDGAALTSFLIDVEVDGRTHPIRAAFVHVDDRPFLASDSPAALRTLAAHAAEAADRLEARHTPGTPS